MLAFHRFIGWRAVIVALCFVGLELGLRQGGYGKWVITERDERLGWVMLPDQDRYSHDLTIEEHINSYGFRDDDWAPPERAGDGSWAKDESVYRVAIVGNSVTYGTSVPVEETWCRVLQDELRALFETAGDARTPLVMNFAVQGYTFEQMARNYEDNIRPFRPDLLVVPTIPHDVAPFEGGVDDFDFPYRRSVVRTATHDWLHKRVVPKWRAAVRPRWAVAGGAEELARAEAQLTARPFGPESRPLWDAAAERMAEVQAMVEADGGRLAIVDLPRLFPVLKPNLKLPSSYWKPWAEERGVAHVDTVDALRESMGPLVGELSFLKANFVNDAALQARLAKLSNIERNCYLIFDLGHYSARGHRVVARTFLRGLIEQGVVP